MDDAKVLDFHAVMTAWRDDQFIAAFDDLAKRVREAKAGEYALEDREKTLKVSEQEAKVVLNSQQTFNKQHSDRMKALKAAEESLESKKAVFQAEKKGSEADLKAEEDRLKVWSADLTRDQNEANAVLETKAEISRDAAKAKENRAMWESKVEALGLKVA